MSTKSGNHTMRVIILTGGIVVGIPTITLCVILLGRLLGPDRDAMAYNIQEKYGPQLERLRTEIRTGGLLQTPEQIHDDWDLFDEPGVLHGSVETSGESWNTLWESDEMDVLIRKGQSRFSSSPRTPGSSTVNLWTYENDSGDTVAVAEYCEIVLDPGGEKKLLKLFVLHRR